MKRPENFTQLQPFPKARQRRSDHPIMNTNPQNEGTIILHSSGIGTVTRKMVRERAVELALIAGRPASDVSKTDWEQAKQELTGSREIESNELVLETISETEGWDSIPGSTGGEAPVTPLEGEDDEGQSLGEKLIDEGMREADHDQMLQAAQVAEKSDRERR